MPLLLNLWGPGENDAGRLEINGKDLIIEFIPHTNSASDTKHAAMRRDRFNFVLSFYLSYLLEEQIDYSSLARITQVQDVEREGYCILLSFSKNVDAAVIQLLFGGEYLSRSELAKFMDEECRRNILEKTGIYFNQLQQNKDEIKERSHGATRHPLDELIQDESNEFAKLDAEYELAAKNHAKHLAQYEEKLDEQSRNLAQLNKELKLLEQAISEFALEEEQQKKSQEVMLEKYHELITQMDQTYAAAKLPVATPLVTLHEQTGIVNSSALAIKMEFETQFVKMENAIDRIQQRNPVAKIVNQYDDGLNSELDDNRNVFEDWAAQSKIKTAYYAKSMALLKKNLAESQTVLVYAAFEDQIAIQRTMKIEQHPDHEIYDDICILDEQDKKFFTELAKQVTLNALAREEELRNKIALENAQVTAPAAKQLTSYKSRSKTMSSSFYEAMSNYTSQARQLLFTTSTTNKEVELKENSGTITRTRGLSFTQQNSK